MFVVSASKLKSFISCPKKYDFIYNEELVPVEKAEALVDGSSYHEKVASILKTGSYEKTNDKIDVMADIASEMLIPQIGEDVVDVETYRQVMLTDDIQLIGYLDAITDSGIPIEHKTTSKAVDEFYVNRLNWDLQVAIYMILTGTNTCIYTVCKKPTIRQKQNETNEEFLERCREWYKEDSENKFGVFEVHRSNEELEQKKKEIIKICEMIEKAELFYRNPSDCSVMGCPYSSICLDYDKNVMPIGYKKRENTRKEENDND